jgi:hypothetical protein
MVNNSTNINKVNNHLSPKESLNSDGQQFYQYGSQLELLETTIDNCVYSLFITYPHPCMATVEVVAFALCYKDQAGGNLS